jgi:hypothetical protein
MNTRLSTQNRIKRFGKNPDLRRFIIDLDRMVDALQPNGLKETRPRRLVPIQTSADVQFNPQITFRESPLQTARQTGGFSRVELSLPDDRRLLTRKGARVRA